METIILKNIPAHRPPTVENWRWINPLCEDGASTVRRDAELFQQVKSKNEPPILRFFCWRNPTLSYGRTQKMDSAIRSEWTDKGWEVLRRPTGGGKVFHLNDICFSLIWRKEHRALPWGIQDSYCAIHRWIQKCLEKLGVESALAAQNSFFTDGKMTAGGWCFQNPVRNDLLLDDRKIVGGAQWRDGGAVLHQGSIQVPCKESEIYLFAETFRAVFSVEFFQTVKPELCSPNN